MITKDDVDFLIHILTGIDPHYPVVKGDEVAHRLKGLKKLWTEEGIPVDEVDIVWASGPEEVYPMTETFNIGSPLSDDSNWKVAKLRAYVKDTDVKDTDDVSIDVDA